MRRYRAFISYSHDDERVAAWLARKLETYRPPAGLEIGIDPIDGQRRLLAPIFRDREDLGVSHSLTEEIQKALQTSDTLIVLCSPRAAQSRWVNEEIRLYKRLHGENARILALIVSGDPDGDAGHSGCFPPTLAFHLTPDGTLTDRRTEPLAADMRPRADGRDMAFLKLASALLGVELDALVRRDYRRRNRNAMRITAAAAAIVLAMGMLTWNAVTARRDAEQSRSDAEGLIEYMMTSLREQLDGVGRIAILEGVDDRAKAYYASLGPVDSLPDDSLERLSRIMIASATDAGKRGDRQTTGQRFTAALRIAEILLARAPNDPARILAHARTLNRLALHEHSGGNQQDAERIYQDALDRLKALGSWGASHPEWIRQTGNASGGVCAAQYFAGTVTETTRQLCADALALGEDMVALTENADSAIYEVSFDLIWLAKVEYRLGHTDQGNAISQRYLDIIDTLTARDPDNMLWREQKAEFYISHAKDLIAQDRQDDANRLLTTAYTLIQSLIENDPDNQDYQRFETRIISLKGDKE